MNDDLPTLMDIDEMGKRDDIMDVILELYVDGTQFYSKRELEKIVK